MKSGNYGATVSLADQYLLPGIGGIIAAIAVVGIAIIALMLRKKQSIEDAKSLFPLF